MNREVLSAGSGSPFHILPLRKVLDVRHLIIGLLYSIVLAGFALPSQAWAAPYWQDAADDRANVLTDETLFDARYDAIVELRGKGDSVAAMELMEQLLQDVEAVRADSEENSATKLRVIAALAMEANLLRDLNRNDESVEKQQRLLEMTKDDPSLPMRLQYLQLRQNYAGSIAQAGKQQEALSELRGVIEDYGRLVTEFPDNKDVVIQAVIASNNLGIQLVRAGRQREAIEIFNPAIERLRKLPADGDARDKKLSLLLLNSAVAIGSIGDPSTARKLIEESIEWKEKLGEGDSQDTIRARLTLGAILGRLNQYAESAETYRIVVDQLRKLFPADKYPAGTLDLAIAIDNHSVSLSRLGKYEQAIKLAEEANGMFAKLAEQSPGLRQYYARSSASLSLLNARLERQELAIENLTSAIEAYEIMFPNGHAELPGLYRSKSIILSELRRDSEAIAAALHSLDMAREQFPADDYPDGHWILAQSLDSTGQIFLAAQKPAEALTYFAEATEMQNRLASQALRHISEAEALQFLAIADRFKSHLLSVAGDPLQTYQLLAGDKSRILDQQKYRYEAARRSRNPELTARLAEYEKVRSSLATLLLQPSRDPNSAALLAKLQRASETLERQLAETTEGELGMLAEPQPVGAGDRLTRAFAQLEDSTILIEFFSYEHMLFNEEAKHRRIEGEQRICAFVLDPIGETVTRVEFGKAEPLRLAIRGLAAAMPFGTEQQVLDAINKSIITPLLSHVPADCRQLAIIPDGIISGVPFACLQNSQTGKTLMESFQLSFLTSLDALQSTSPIIQPETRVLAVGAVEYGPVLADQPLQFTQLPGTRVELDNLASRISPQNWRELSGEHVTPESLLEAIETVELIHLATHAYVKPIVENTIAQKGVGSGAVRLTAEQRSPLLATRMALSGANDPAENTIVTGDRFAATNLSGAKLVVLSACESGVGERVLGEGVFGLQRAFHVAGAKHVIATHWPVSDTDAVQFMDAFYQALLEQRLPPIEALRRAQLSMLEAETQTNASSLRQLARRGITFNFQTNKGTPENATEDQASESSAPNSGPPQPSKRSTWAAFFLSVD